MYSGMMRIMKKITIFFSVIVVIIVFVMISYMKSSNVEFDYKNINNIATKTFKRKETKK